MRGRCVVLVGWSAIALGLSSCGKGGDRKPTFPVAGKVLVNGKPAAHATVVFHPVGGAGPDAVKPRGKVAADGSFKLTTYDGGDGAPAGDYRVTVELWLSTGKGDEGPTSRLPATVGAGPTELQPFEAKRQTHSAAASRQNTSQQMAK